MDRRKFLTGAAGVGAASIGVAVVAKLPETADFQPIVVPDGKISSETILGETVQFSTAQDFSTDTITYFARWRDYSQIDKPVYALGARCTQEQLMQDPESFAKRKRAVRESIKNTISIKKRGIHLYSHSAPLKPEGCSTILI